MSGSAPGGSADGHNLLRGHFGNTYPNQRCTLSFNPAILTSKILSDKNSQKGLKAYPYKDITAGLVKK